MKRLIRIMMVIDAAVLLVIVPFTIKNLGTESRVNAEVAVATSTTPDNLYLTAPVNLHIAEKQDGDTLYHTALLSILKKIAHCESNGNPLAKNSDSSAKGLLQILDSTWADFQCSGNVYNSSDNLKCGLKIAQESGLHHWDQSRFCWAKLVQT